MDSGLWSSTGCRHRCRDLLALHPAAESFDGRCFVTYDQQKERVLINSEKWFTGIPPEVWEYHIGGYRVSEKWLKDRKGKELSSEEVAHYARVVTAIAETISIQRFLDDLFAEVETSLLQVRL